MSINKYITAENYIISILSFHLGFKIIYKGIEVTVALRRELFKMEKAVNTYNV